MTDQDLMQTTIKSIKNFLDIDFTWNEKGTKNGGHMYDGILKMVRENKELKYLIEINKS
ncbi:MAG: hypothetical protein IPO37_12110 [Saprospiraceae bacterium]|nr:hypothetical protein [Saprospiraceae bacterium]